MNVTYRDSDFTLRIMGIDNGTSVVGMSIIDLCLRSGVGTVVHAEEYEPERDGAYDRLPNILDRRGRPHARIKYTRRWLMDRLDEFQPHSVGCESPFASFSKPDRISAYGPLVVSIASIGDTVEEYSDYVDFLQIPPGSAKRAVIHSGKPYSSDKDVIAEYIRTHPKIRFHDSVDPKRIGSDAMDSVAVGWYVAERANAMMR